MKIHLIRHTTPDIEKGICYGQSDLGLADSFQSEKQSIHNKLNMPFDAVYTSPLQRCSKLAETLSAPLHYTDHRLMEYNFGDWEMLPWATIKSQDIDSWMNNFVEQAAPNGDSILTMQQRVLAFWEELQQQEFERVAVVTHSGVQRLVHAAILSVPLTHIFRLQLDFGAIMEINHNSQDSVQTIRHL